MTELLELAAIVAGLGIPAAFVLARIDIALDQHFAPGQVRRRALLESAADLAVRRRWPWW